MINHRVSRKVPAIGAALMITFGIAGCAVSPVIVGPLHPPIQPRQVMVFEPPFVPKHYTVVAKLDATGYGGCSSRGVDRLILANLRKQAARLGANGILMVSIGKKTQSESIALGGCAGDPLAKAEAIYVPRYQ